MLLEAHTEKDLGIVIDRSGKSLEQCILAARRANTSWND